VLLFLWTGCASQKKVSYLQDVPAQYEQLIETEYEPDIQPDDMLYIVVNSREQELARMLNLPLITNYVSGTSIHHGWTLGYSVDKNGNINFPQLGRIKAAGMTCTELKEYLQKRLVESGLVKDPTVTIQYLNFSVSVIGEVAKPGTFNVSGNRITVLDAISQAGDLTIYGKRDNVRVIREENGKRTIATLDLRSGEIFTSPYYYLHQNDVVYVEPNRVKAGQREINQNRTIGTFASIVSVLISLAVLIWK
jgi:polysaccharide export outer membrane protein